MIDIAIEALGAFWQLLQGVLVLTFAMVVLTIVSIVAGAPDDEEGS